MADDTHDTAETAEQKDDQKADAPPWGEDFDPARAWKTIQTLRAREQELEPLAKRARELEEAQKSELQKAVERAEAAERKAQDAERGRSRADIARETGVPPRFVVGESEDEMREAAKEYLADREQTQAEKARRSDVDQGVRGTAADKPDMNNLIRSAAGRS